jgi:RNA polymerase sigma factor (sigma-70 family)
MHEPGSITAAIQALGHQDVTVAERLWDRFFERLCRFVERRIAKRHLRLIDPDEVASNAFLALIDGIKAKRFERVRNRDELWQMLMLIAARDASNARRRIGQAKRGGGKVVTESAFGPAGINNVIDYIGRDPGPEMLAQLQELSQKLLQGLPDDRTRQVALLRMAGYSTAEIAEELACVERTVERKLKIIRDTWNRVNEK